MSENLFNVKIIILNSTTQYMIRTHLRTSKCPVAKKWYPWDHGLLRAVNSLQR